MRPDQLARLKSLSERLTDCVLDEADPDLWPGAGVEPSQMSKDERGDRFWCKKNAAATFALIVRCDSMISDAEDPTRQRTPRDDEADVEKVIHAKEREAAQILERVMGTTLKAGRGKA